MKRNELEKKLVIQVHVFGWSLLRWRSTSAENATSGITLNIEEENLATCSFVTM